jgi:nitroimidazol reductase NimA-like FMN-containing flavoprotein (pyridoxamine 5'-phosphate oxidase superfamily)
MAENPPPIPLGSLHELGLHECEELLVSMPIGRVGFVHAGQPTILPVNFRYVDGEILFRTFDGEKFGAAQTNHRVAFEVDDWDAELRIGWSVLVKGRAETVVEWDKARAADDLGLDPWTGLHDHSPWVRIKPFEITGRRVGVS